jgi:hypothetical protein
MTPNFWEKGKREENLLLTISLEIKNKYKNL